MVLVYAQQPEVCHLQMAIDLLCCFCYLDTNTKLVGSIDRAMGYAMN